MSANWRTARGVSPSPQVFSRGNSFFSTTTTSHPASASQYPHEAPAGPAPTTTTSCTRSDLPRRGAAAVAVRRDVRGALGAAFVGACFLAAPAGFFAGAFAGAFPGAVAGPFAGSLAVLPVFFGAPPGGLASGAVTR